MTGSALRLAEEGKGERVGRAAWGGPSSWAN